MLFSGVTKIYSVSSISVFFSATCLILCICGPLEVFWFYIKVTFSPILFITNFSVYPDSLLIVIFNDFGAALVTNIFPGLPTKYTYANSICLFFSCSVETLDIDDILVFPHGVFQSAVMHSLLCFTMTISLKNFDC